MDIELDLHPQHILDTPLLNKGTAFTQKERDDLKLNGYLPYRISTIEEQAQRRYQNFQQQPNELSKFLFLSTLQNRNEILFYKLVSDHIAEMLPLIYTPTVGDVSMHYSSLYKDHRGLYLSYPLRDKMEEMIQSISNECIDVIVVTDGERILGLGDVGIGGMAIPVGKLSLYTLFGGIHPARTLPVFLDVGTDNEELLQDEHYVGWRHKRIRGEEYRAFVDRFIQGIKKRYPKVLLQWEDFAKPNARPLLEKYQEQILSFNDDIQGTASVVLSALLTASRLAGRELKEQKIALLGGGSAGLGICEQILDALEMEGICRKEAMKNFYVVDICGLITSSTQNIDPSQRKFAVDAQSIHGWKVNDISHITLQEVIENAQPSILIGVSTQAGAFTEEIVTRMSSYVDRPVILPLSNPTSKSEARPEDLIQWSQGKAIIATGSPFPSVMYQGVTHAVAQCNNVSIFPGLGLGLVSVSAQQTSKRMFVAAAKRLSDFAPILKESEGSLFPPFSQLREVSKEIAFTVAKIAVEENLCEKLTDEEIKQRIECKMWSAVYPTYKRKQSSKI